MGTTAPSDEALLASRDAADFELFYSRHVEDQQRRRPDRLTAYALDDGERVASTQLDTFGSTGLVVLGREVWVNATGGRTLVVRR
jgi:hypothetical protein